MELNKFLIDTVQIGEDGKIWLISYLVVAKDTEQAFERFSNGGGEVHAESQVADGLVLGIQQLPDGSGPKVLQ